MLLRCLLSMKINRRKFIKSTGGLLALAALDLSNFNCAGIDSHEQVYSFRPPKGPNERLNVAVIGLGGRSSSHLGQFNAQKNCRITHICDPDTAKAEQAMGRARNSNGEGVPDPIFVQDLRRVFDDKDVDVISIASCNHWHALASIWAMQAGKDVYAEKPISHNLSEGRRIVQTVQRTGRIFQSGTQMRSNAALVESMAYVQSGALGKVQLSRALCYKTRNSIGKVTGPQEVPSTCDYNLWCGPAPMTPLMREKLHYEWHWIWDTGNGDIGNQGIHEIDVARWALGDIATPKSVQTIGGRFGYVDDGQTPNTQLSLIDYGPGQAPMIIEVRGLTTQPYKSRGVENVVHCENGYLVSPTYTSAIAYDRDGNVLKNFNGGGDTNHFNNFIEVVRSRKAADLHAPALQGHQSCVAMHLANISLQVGKQMHLDSNHGDLFASSREANEAMQRMEQHLVENKVSLAEANCIVGPKLNFDAANETFTNNSSANRLLTREYRKPFVVPARV